MHNRWAPAVAGYGAGAGQEGSLTPVRFVGSYPAADFPTSPRRPEIAFLGRSNVGKSTLLNALVGRRALARTSQTPGKTQACNLYAVDETYYLVDLPGYGYARASKRTRRTLRALVNRYVAERTALTGVVWLLDIRHEPSGDDLDVGDWLARHRRPTLVALTKSDKITRGRHNERRTAIAHALGVPETQCILTSAKTKAGLGTLRDSIAALVARPLGREAQSQWA